ncbi:NUDIX hydrolase [Paenibacillus sp. SAF-054]|uniref:NUDIX hydrolase n=1 Tax=unclassified Paenibacillus TaxID=185978 RepID=UPI003F81D439
MYKYTLCFIKRGNKLLMLNRDYAPAKGLWNGVGGKLEGNETPLECVLRESFEETGIILKEAEYRGVVSWDIDNTYSGGMYAFFAEISNDYEYTTPKRVDEGILDWKDIEWILSEGNFGVGEMIPRFLPVMLRNPECYEHKCTLVNNKLINYDAISLASY